MFDGVDDMKLEIKPDFICCTALSMLGLWGKSSEHLLQGKTFLVRDLI